jgi:hypothetical protein
MSTTENITKIPWPGGSGRVPSGAMQFEDDWPGLFIRGDDAVVLGMRIRGLLDALKEKRFDDPRVWLATIDLEEWAGVIERDVRIKPCDQK